MREGPCGSFRSARIWNCQPRSVRHNSRAGPICGERASCASSVEAAQQNRWAALFGGDRVATAQSEGCPVPDLIMSITCDKL
jgi:hypothetical protein